MSCRRHCGAMLMIIIACLVSSAVFAKKPPDDERQSHQEDKSEQMSKLDLRVSDLRERMNVPDAEWSVMLPRIIEVEQLSKAAHDFHDRKASDFAKPFKLKELADDRASQTRGALSSAVAELNNKAQALGALMENKNASNADIAARLAAYRTARTQAEKRLLAELTDARAKLTELLSVRQEFICVVSGLLD